MDCPLPVYLNAMYIVPNSQDKSTIPELNHGANESVSFTTYAADKTPQLEEVIFFSAPSQSREYKTSIKLLSAKLLEVLKRNVSPSWTSKSIGGVISQPILLLSPELDD